MFTDRRSHVPQQRSILFAALLCLAILLPALPPLSVIASPQSDQLVSSRVQDVADPLIAFRKGGNVWLMNADGSDQRQLTTDGKQSSLDNLAEFPYAVYQWHSWSPDGSYLLMVRDTYLSEGGNASSRDFFLYDVVADTVTLLTSGLEPNPFQPAWALDTNQIAYISEEGDIYGDHQPLDVTSTIDRIDLTGEILGSMSIANRRTIPPEILYFQNPSLELWYQEYLRGFYVALPAIQWSTNNDTALFFTGAGSVVELIWSTGVSQVLGPGDPELAKDGSITGRVSSLPNGATTDASRPAGDLFGPLVGWSPDRSRYVFSTAETVRDQQRLTPADGSVEWDRNLIDRHVVLWSANADGSDLQRLYEVEAFGLGVPSVAPDSSFVVFSEIENPTELWDNRLPGDLYNREVQETYAPHIRVMKVDLATGGVTELAEDAGRPAVQPVTVAPGTAEFSPIATQPTVADDSHPGGGLVAFIRDDDMWLMESDGSNQRQITEFGEPVQDFSWSPTGRYLLIEHGGPRRTDEAATSSDWITSFYDVVTGEIKELRRTVPAGLWPGVPKPPVWALDSDELIALDLHLQETTNYTLTHLTLDGTATTLVSFDEPLVCGGPDGPFATMWQLVYLQKGGPWTRNVYDPIIWSAGDQVAYVDPQCGERRIVDLASGQVSEFSHNPIAGSNGRLLVQGEGASWQVASVFDPVTDSSIPLHEGDAFSWGPKEYIYLTRVNMGNSSSFRSKFDDFPGNITDNAVEVWRTDANADELVRVASFPGFGAGVPRVTADGSALVVGIVDNPSAIIGIDESGSDVFSPHLYAEHLKAVRIDVESGEVSTLTVDAMLPKPQPSIGLTVEPESSGQVIEATEPPAKVIDPVETPTDESAPATEAVGQPEDSSADGWIAYVGDDGNIWLMQPDGSSQTQVTTDGGVENGISTYLSPNWSHDGTMLTFSEYPHGGESGGVWVLRDGTLHLLPNTSACLAPVFSPDNQRVLYSCQQSIAPGDPMPSDLASNPLLGFVSSSMLDGSDQRIEVPYSADRAGVPWTSDGKAFHYAGQIDVRLSDGMVMVVYHGHRKAGVFLFDVDGSMMDQFNLSGPDGMDLGPYDARFTPDGEGIIATVCTYGCFPMEDGEQVFDIMTVDLTGKVVREWTKVDAGQRLNGVDISPDGLTVVSGNWYTTATEGEIVVRQGPEQRLVIGAGTQPAWQPNPGVTPQVPVSNDDSQAIQPSGPASEPTEAGTGAVSVPSAFIGTWDGRGTQVNPSVEWPVTIDLTSGSQGDVVGTSEYPNDGCGGNLSLQEVTADTIVLIENLTYGLDACTDGGTIILGLRADTALSFEWVGVRDDGSSSSATGSLERRGSEASVESSQPSRATMPDDYLGTWLGTGVQVNPSVEWPLTIDLTGGDTGAVVGTSDYPNDQCGGNLILQEVTADSIILIEQLTYGQGACTDGGTITLSGLDVVAVHFEWNGTRNDGSASSATGTLFRPDSETGVSVSAQPVPFTGYWGGTGYQNQPAVDWSILILINDGVVGEGIGHAEYPSFDCIGVLTLTAVNGDGSITLREDMVVGEERCVDGGEFTLRKTAGTGDIEFRWVETGGMKVAEGVLVPVNHSGMPLDALANDETPPGGLTQQVEASSSGEPVDGGPPSIYGDPAGEEVVPIEPEGNGG